MQVGAAYAFPPGTDGTGQAVAIIELGGGFAQDDLDTYFSGLGIAAPTVTAIGVDGASNQAGSDPQGADGEVLLDIEVIGALAPGAAINVYFAPNTDAGFLDAVSEAVHADPTPAAISISWGQSEDDWTAQARAAMDSVFADAVQLGIVVTAAAGDNGSTDGATDGSDHCDFPASSPNVLGCGGTSLSRQQRDGLEQRRRQRRDRRRGQRRVRPPAAPGRRRRARHGTRRARRRGQRRPADRLPGAGRRIVAGHRRHQRGRPAVGGAGRPAGAGDRRAAARLRRPALRRRSRPAAARPASTT